MREEFFDSTPGRQQSASAAPLKEQGASSPIPAAPDTGVVQAMKHSYWMDATGHPLLPDEQPVGTVRDSLYDLIPLGARELKLINSAPFLRLQQVKQLGFVYRVWPGATHSRYEHSLGCYHLAVRALRALLLRGSDGGLDGISISSIQTLMVAALLHDIGHYPFSHTIEDLGFPIVQHEKVGRSIIEKSEIATILERDYRLSPERVADFIDPPKFKSLPQDDELLSHLLSGALDIDKLDYLPRDARACNVPYGGVDVSRLLSALRVHRDPHGERCLVVTHKGISPLHSLLHARQEMFDNIYWHHTSRSFQAMLVRAVYDALTSQALNSEQLVGLTDAALLTLLASEKMPESARALAADLEMRRPYRVVLEVSPAAGSMFRRLEALFWDAHRRRAVEQKIAAELSTLLEQPVADYEILFEIPRPEKWEMDVWIAFDHPPVGMKPLMKWVEATGLQPDDLARYEQHQRRIRIVTAERLRPPIHNLGEGVLLGILEQLI
ncbi:phosphohydrolase [Dictyobacter sp. S3.2.2.5]|uniref:Phosphohydrolase n=1 Tax=Dictyobacter halimunensis TaxID=3026934 RepID=A0ABQ6G1D8_9CHLR|nr:phosphohydrolase [Dictyobacter sp. S3.2.2.5]